MDIPHNDVSDFRDTWRIFRIMAELVEGYNFLTGFSKEVSIFGSARFPEQHLYSVIAQELANLLGKQGFTIVTGGGPGIMQAANRGAFEAGAESVGLNIELPNEQRVNPYVKKSMGFNYFFTRKVMLTSPTDAFVYFPGGYGTMDEFFEVMDLMDQGMLTRAPIVLVGTKFWLPLVEFLSEHGVTTGSIQANELDQVTMVDTAEAAYDLLKDVEDSRAMLSDLSANNFYSQGSIDWKIFRVMAELVEGFEFVSGITHAVTVLGTKSIRPDSPYYVAAHELGALLAEHEYAVVTGAKEGVAEAANKGAFEAGGVSLGIGMRVGPSAAVNPYLTRSIQFNYPFTRKLIITAPTKAFVFFPGGLGTMHQLFEILTLIQTKKMDRVPVILYDAQFWQPLAKYIEETMRDELHTIASGDEDLYEIIDTIAGVVERVEQFHTAKHV
jgi:uncharacterized protein (TIGR00730 family)